MRPRAGLILEGAREGRREEWALLADILPDCRFDVAASQRIRRLFVGSHLGYSFVENEVGSLTGRGEPMHISQRKREAEVVAGVPERKKRRE